MSSTSTSKLPDLPRLEARLGYEFKDKALLLQALTHKSHSRQHNERLEFLGDAVLGYLIADILFSDHPAVAEDALTINRANLVKGATLGEIATTLGLGSFLRLGAGERKSGGRQRASILADTLEAVIGAVSLDGGVDAARTLVSVLFRDRLDALAADPGAVQKDAKTRLQEHLQARSLALPAYEIQSTGGTDHHRTFTVACRVDPLELTTTGTGLSRRGAEQAAAEAMLEHLQETS